MTGAETFTPLPKSAAGRAAELSQRIHRQINHTGNWRTWFAVEFQADTRTIVLVNTGWFDDIATPEVQATALYRLGVELRIIAMGNATTRRFET